MVTVRNRNIQDNVRNLGVKRSFRGTVVVLESVFSCVTFIQRLSVPGLHRLRDRGEGPGSGELTSAVWHLELWNTPFLSSISCHALCVRVCVLQVCLFSLNHLLPVLDNASCWLSSSMCIGPADHFYFSAETFFSSQQQAQQVRSLFCSRLITVTFRSLF